ncbi:hypothetical protein [Nostoc sp. 'Peltigera membranacea cyanobiont' N6]|uniref:hypothetical protein n=1 Tax=Nostoc sp. 'Peltigera membranacea cyanobiont' N6 TaxID=1261031 RepID=UPI0011B0E80D|nr:hypothetical protein [Nostoc sp. 'Peltigera membranacea cyanobiont' N6]
MCKIYCFNEGNFLSAVEPKFLEEKFGWAIAPLCPRTNPQTWEAIAPFAPVLLEFNKHKLRMRANAQAMSATGFTYAPLLSSKNWVGQAIAPLQLLHLNPRHFQHYRRNRHKPPHSCVIAIPHWRCS